MSSATTSEASIKKATFEVVDQELVEENVLDSLPSEFRFNADNMMRLIEHTAQELRATCFIPMMIRNPHTTRLSLEGTQYEALLTILEDFSTRKNQGEFDSIPPERNSYLAAIYDYIHENPAVVRELPPWALTEKLSYVLHKENYIAALDAMENLLHASKINLFRPAVLMLQKEREIHFMQAESGRLRIAANEMNRQCRATKFSNVWSCTIKRNTFKKKQNKLDQKKLTEDRYVGEKISNLRNNTRTSYNESEKNASKLEEEHNNIQKQYEAACHKNEHGERDARAERNKLQLQLMALVKKHDQQLTQRYREHLDLIEEFDETQEQFEAFMEDYEREEEAWIEQVRAKQEQEAREDLGRQALYAMNRAARVIQNFWRKWRKAKRAQKSGKKKK